MKLKTIGSLVAATLAVSTTLALGAGQEALIKPIDKELTFVFIPKVIHPGTTSSPKAGNLRRPNLRRKASRSM